MLRMIFSRLMPVLVAVGLFANAPAKAAYPDRPVMLIVPFAAGGITDILARLTAERLGDRLKGSFIVENRPGAGGVVAANHVLKSEPDGHTLLFSPIFQITTAPLVNPAVTFDATKDFEPIAAVGATPFVITVRGDFPGETLADFIGYVKKRPGKLPFASAGTGSMTHFSSTLFLNSAGIEMIHVPYKGVAPAFNDMMAGHVLMLSASPVEIKPYMESKKVKPLAVTNSERSAQLPDVPAITEFVKDSPPVVTYNGLLAPAGTPKAVIDAISEVLIAAEKDPQFRARVAKIGVETVKNTPQEFRQIIMNDAATWAGIIKALKLKK